MTRREQINAAACRRGHSFSDPANVYVNPKTGKRQCQVCKLAAMKRWRLSNVEHVREHWQVWYEANRERRLTQYQPQWKAANRQVLRDHEARRRAQAVDGPRDADTLNYLAVIETDPCAYCGNASAHDEHIVPLVLGGEHHWSNLARACRRCNSSKRHRPLLLWLAGRPKVAA